MARENTYDSYKVIVNKICDYFEDKTITIKHKAIETIKDNKRFILLKDKTKNYVEIVIIKNI